MNQQLYSTISTSVPARTRTITSTRTMNNTMSSTSSLYSSTAASIATVTMPSYEGFQPPFDNSQQECCSSSSSSSSSSMFPNYEDYHHHEEQDNMLMDNNKSSTITTTTSNGNNTNMSDSTMPTTTSSNKNNATTTTTTTEFKATFYNPFETKHRRRTSKQQFKILEAAFEENAKPSAAKRQALADELQMTPRGVQIWFQNRRAKAKQRIDHINISSNSTSNSDSNNRSSNNKRSFDDSSSTLDEEDEYNTHQHRRRRTTSNYNKPFYTEWDSQEPIVTNDGTTINHTTSTTTATTTATTIAAAGTAATTTTNDAAAAAAAAATMSPHVTTSTPASPPCITGIHPVQAPSLCYSYSDASSSPVTPSVPSPTMQDQQEYQSQQPHHQPQLHSEPSHQQQQQPDFLIDYTSKPMWSTMDDGSLVAMDNTFVSITDWMQAVPPPIRPSLRQDASITSIATTASGFGSEEDEILSQWASKNHQIASFPNSPQQSEEQHFPQPIIHNTADNKDNSIALAPVFDVSSMMDSAITVVPGACNFVPASNIMPWIPQQPHPELVMW